MSMLSIEFSVQMRKRVAGSVGEFNHISDGKCPKKSSPDEES